MTWYSDVYESMVPTRVTQEVRKARAGRKMYNVSLLLMQKVSKNSNRTWLGSVSKGFGISELILAWDQKEVSFPNLARLVLRRKWAFQAWLDLVSEGSKISKLDPIGLVLTL